MDLLTFDNPVFAVYAVAAALGVLKVMGQGWVTVWRMTTSGGGYASPEDARPGLLNRAPRAGQLDPVDEVERSRRMHRNDLENIPGFWVAGLLFVLTGPPLWLAWLTCGGFVLARAGHAWAYAAARGHETRATFYTAGSLVVIYMAVHVLVAALA
ncbi:MAPEG family protein [Roseibacterium sp. SDUM158017]|uniref:MAPEG family protein n=1 Tax=Roseicyclus salinarum TaxID=3036773 RepID=UPI0024154616|nr:MAPEG family protein [Roseibacterium sp. SDUM158017]MDG4648273.1 MAPEG family protein [Roseibacterium sp. SDUM158017]